MHAEAYQAVTAAINLTAMHVVCTASRGPASPGTSSACTTLRIGPRTSTASTSRASLRPTSRWAGGTDGVFAHDWRVEPPADWLMGARVPMPLRRGRGGLEGSAPPLGPAEFQRRGAAGLARLHPRRLPRTGPSPAPGRLVREAGDAGGRRGEPSRRLLNEAAETPLADPRDQKLHRAVWLTYFEPLGEARSGWRNASRLPFSAPTGAIWPGVSSGSHAVCGCASAACPCLSVPSGAGK